MSLLMRRRSPQAMTLLSEPGFNRKASVPTMPDDFDPAIRGSVVHDFSAPRPRRDFSYGSTTVATGDPKSPYRADFSQKAQSTPNERLGYVDSIQDKSSTFPGDGSIEKEYPPVLTDHSEDHPPLGDSHESPSQSFENLSGEFPSPTKKDAKPLPPFPQSLQTSTRETSVLPKTRSSGEPDPSTTIEINPVGKLDKQLEIEVPQCQDIPPSEYSYESSRLPRHMKSNASRFSFDMAGMGSSAQEKVLEEKHRQKAKARTSITSVATNDSKGLLSDEDEYDDDYNLDEFDDGGYEEKIPGVNVDDDEYEGRTIGINAKDDDYEQKIPGTNTDDDEPTIRPINTGFNFYMNADSPTVNSTSPSQDTTAIVSTPRDAAGQIIGFATTKESPTPQKYENGSFTTPLTPEYHPDDRKYVADLGLIGFSNATAYNDPSRAPLAGREIGAGGFVQTPPHVGSDDDDMYFDDGMIDQPPEEGDQKFDESWFDNGADDLAANPRRNDSKHTASYLGLPKIDQLAPTNSVKASDSPWLSMISDTTSSISQRDVVVTPQTKLDAYHNSLVAAANAAAASGKFSRRDDEEGSLDFEGSEAETLGAPADQGRAGINVQFLPVVGGDQAGIDDYGFEDELEDDPIIAAANAEALANDEDGFYGQEFGFYAQKNGESHESINGGYFGDPSSLLRSQSGRLTLHEPNLTPITERSEQSNRNSVASLSFHAFQSSPATHQSPALAQLQNMMNENGDEDISLSTLLKLRRGAFGGSNGSLRSSQSGGSHANGSPLSHMPPATSGLSTSLGKEKTNIEYSPAGSNENDSPVSRSDLDSFPDSPVIGSSHQTANWAPSNPGRAVTSSVSPPASPVSPLRRSGAWKKGHSRPGSGADSISYIKEEDESGEERWVIEKRRMSQQGEMEVVGREMLGAGRI
ncbi:MAG: hypothetical protein M1824_000012 [Vezdaea acicularis]|nr:MAG: hypothetical protein M1824_000012 [Vezdaea acicularis]